MTTATEETKVFVCFEERHTSAYSIIEEETGKTIVNTQIG